MISCWSIKGLNDPLKQSEVHLLTVKNQITVLCIIETKVRSCNIEKVWAGLRLIGWRYWTNHSDSDLGRL